MKHSQHEARWMMPVQMAFVFILNIFTHIYRLFNINPILYLGGKNVERVATQNENCFTAFGVICHSNSALSPHFLKSSVIFHASIHALILHLTSLNFYEDLKKKMCSHIFLWSLVIHSFHRTNSINYFRSAVMDLGRYFCNHCDKNMRARKTDSGKS